MDVKDMQDISVVRKNFDSPRDRYITISHLLLLVCFHG
jgi:hypothetical protein